MAERVMALYLEDNNIKLLVTKGRKVERWATTSLDAGLVKDGVIVNENKVADKIREMFVTIKHTKGSEILSGKGKVIVGLSGRDSLYRVLSLPVISEALLPEAVRREAGRVLPVSLNELYLAYQRIPGNASEIRVFVAAFPKKTTDVLVRTMRLAGVNPRVLDLAPLALCQSVNEPRAIIVDARQDNLNIMVMAERVPQVIRSLAMQSEGKSISENMPTIIEEFSRTVAFYNSSHQQSPIGSEVPVFVSGDLVNVPATWPALVGKLNSKVSVLPTVIDCPENFPASEFIINLGLATKELALEKEAGNYSLVNLNALPASALPQPVNPYRIIVPVVAVAGIAICYLLWNNWQNTKNDIKLLQIKLTATQNQITISNKAVATLTEQNRVTQSQIQPILDTANVFTKKLGSISTSRLLTDTDVHQIIAKKQDTVSITGLMYSDTKTVVGVSASNAEILAYAQTLRDSAKYTVLVATIHYNPIVKENGDVVPSYEYTFQIK